MSSHSAENAEPVLRLVTERTAALYGDPVEQTWAIAVLDDGTEIRMRHLGDRVEVRGWDVHAVCNPPSLQANVLGRRRHIVDVSAAPDDLSTPPASKPGGGPVSTDSSAEQGGTLALVCPYCGATVTINQEWQGRPYLQEQVPESIECYAGDCEATWEPNGVPRDAPKWERYPDVYAMPQRARERAARPSAPPAPRQRPECHNADADACSRCIEEADRG